MNKRYSGVKDINGKKIYIGNTLKSPYGYYVRVVKKDKGRFVGKLLCKKTHPCNNMDYCIDNTHEIVGWEYSDYIRILEEVVLDFNGEL